MSYDYVPMDRNSLPLVFGQMTTRDDGSSVWKIDSRDNWLSGATGSSKKKTTPPKVPTPQWAFKPSPFDQAPAMPPYGSGSSDNPWLRVPQMQPWMNNPAGPPQSAPPVQSWGMDYGADPQKLWEQWAQMGQMYGTP